MTWFKDLFKVPEWTSSYEPTSEPTYSQTEEPNLKTYPMTDFKITVNTDGGLSLSLGGFTINVGREARHDLLDKIQKAVNMADLADPDNEPLMRALKEGK